MQHSATWLCPEPADRERLVEMDERLAPAQVWFFAALSIGIVAVIPRYGAWILGPLLGAVLFGYFSRRLLADRWAPEYTLAATAVFGQSMLAIGIMMSGGAESPVMPIMLIAAALLPARFSGRGLTVFVGIALALMIVPAVAIDPAAAARKPELLLACVAGMLGLVKMVHAITRSDHDHRVEASRDQLTGLLNRRALTARFPQILRSASDGRLRVALLTCDIDFFKRVNDEHGHARGDAVLTAFAERITGELRASDMAFRWGGEEFVVAAIVEDATSALQTAERLRGAVAAEPIDGLPLTISIGVALSCGQQTDFEALFTSADAALYRAKGAGRDRVVVATTPLTVAA